MSHSPLSYTYRYRYLCELELTTIDYEVYSGVTEYSSTVEVKWNKKAEVLWKTKRTILVCLPTSGHTYVRLDRLV
jgi:hypothetical protein